MINGLHKLFEIFNLRGGPVMGLWSLAMIFISIYSVIYDKKIDGSIAGMYGTAVAAYAVSKTFKDVKTAEGGNV